ncbi:MAG: putative porin [Chryseolinea sp.]
MPDKIIRMNDQSGTVDQRPTGYLFIWSVFIILAFMLCFESNAQNQSGERRKGSKIIDDSTKQVYGPKTTRYYYERDVLLNKLNYHTIDTAIHNFHRWTYVQRNNYQIQDLGNVATSSRSIFYRIPDVIGATSGFTTYDLYWDTEQVKYFDTKSPYANMYVMLGGKGRSITRATFSRNISPRWNFGITYRALLIDKQVQRRAKGDRNVRAQYFDLFTSYQSKDSSYRLFANFRRGGHEADEYAGIKKNSTFVYSDYYFTNAQPSLLDASSKDVRMAFHLFHQYEVAKALQFYHVLDRYRQATRFTDIASTSPTNYIDFADVTRKTYYDHTEDHIDSIITEDRTKFKYLRNEIGFKGNLLKLFYNGYVAVRHYTFTNNHVTYNNGPQRSGYETYLGGRMALRLDSLVDVGGWGELQQNGNYRLEGTIKSKWFEASLKQAQYSTPLIYETYRGAHDSWDLNFSPVNVTQLNGYLHYDSKVFSVSPGLTFTRLGNYTYFKYNYVPAEADTLGDQKVLPAQAPGQQVIFSPELKFSLTVLKRLTLSSQVIYTKLLESSQDAIQIPKLFVNAQLSYANIFFNGNLDMQTGVDLHYQSTYYALAYDVPIQQFYVQNVVQTKAFPIVDLFFSTRIKKGRLFFKYNNIVQAFTKQGYIVTPEYPGQRNILDFGFDWSFYD